MTPASIRQVVSTPTEFTDIEVIISGIIVSMTNQEFWLIERYDDIDARNAILIDVPQLAELLIENVPLLGGNHFIYHYASLIGYIRQVDHAELVLAIRDVRSLVVSTQYSQIELI